MVGTYITDFKGEVYHLPNYSFIVDQKDLIIDLIEDEWMFSAEDDLSTVNESLKKINELNPLMTNEYLMSIMSATGGSLEDKDFVRKICENEFYFIAPTQIQEGVLSVLQELNRIDFVDTIMDDYAEVACTFYLLLCEFKKPGEELWDEESFGSYVDSVMEIFKRTPCAIDLSAIWLLYEDDGYSCCELLTDGEKGQEYYIVKMNI